MIQLKLEANGKYYYYDPLEKLIIPNGYQLNENLQHQETQCSLRIAYDSELHKILVENQNIPAKLVDDDKIIFTGTIDSGISWTDNGNPEPLECFNITIFDNSGKLQATTESEFAMINKSLTEIIDAICDRCGIICNRTNFPGEDAPIVPVFILPAEKEFYQPLSDLLFEYGYAFGFDNNGYFGLINLTQPQSTTFHDDWYTGVKFSRTKKKYTGLSVTYGQLVQKNNEQVFFEGGDLDAENKILPIVIQPGSYYPWESDPIIEADEGQVFQQFATGFAEEKTLYNGEKKYQRNNNSKLIYTTNHELVPDFSDNLTVDRNEFSFTQASIRFHNTSTTDATLKQLAIRATAFYRQEQQIILGSGKKFEYQTNYLYNKAKTDAFVEILKKYFLGGNFKITFKTDAEFIPGTKTKLNTGLSGITADVLILSCEKDFDNENYTINAITIQDISLDEKKYQTQKSMTADQLIQRTEYTTTKSKGAWTASTVYNTGDIVYLNGNSYICTANHTSGTSFSTTNWNLIASKGADGKNAITMTSATTPNGEYNGQIGIWRGQVYSWNGSNWVLTSGVLPTDPVLHYSFDDLPDLPDGGSVIYAKNKDWKTTDSFSGSATLSVENGCLVLDGKGVLSYAYRFFSTHSNCYLKITMSYDTSGSVVVYENVTGDSVLTTLNFVANEEKTVILKLSNNNRVIGFYQFTGKITIKELYIGDASYTTPVIDNSGNNHNATDVKGLVTKGVSGKCFNFNGVNSSFITQAPSLGGEISFSFWIKLQNKSHTGTICQSRLVIGEGFSIFYHNNILRFDYGSSQGLFGKFVPEMEKLYHIVITQSATDKTLFVDGVKIQQIAASLSRDAEYSQYMWFGLSGTNANKPTLLSNALQGSLDDFQIFDRALSDQEVLGLYLARGNTPKQYTMADYQLDNSSGKYYGYEKPAVPFKNDTYLDTTTGYLYEYDGVKWVAITDVTDTRYNQAVNDMIAFATNNPTLPFLTARNAWIERLAVDGLLANKIATQELILRENGAIKSSNYIEGESGFLINSNGNAEFYTGRFRGGLGTVLKLSETNIVELKFHGIKRISIFREIITSSNNSPISNELGRPVGELLLTERIDYKSGTTEIYSRTTVATGRLYDYVEISMGTDGNWKFPILEFDPPSLSSLSYIYWGCVEQVGPEEVQ